MFIFGLVLYIILKLRFPAGTPISTIILRRYGRPVLKLFRDVEKTDLKVKKLGCDIGFLEQCKIHNLTPKFVRFKLACKNLYRTKIYRNFQKQILDNEIKNKRDLLKKCSVKLSSLNVKLKQSTSWLSFNHFVSYIGRTNEHHIARFRHTHNSKLFRLGLECEVEKLDPERLIFNYSSRVLTKEEKEALAFGLKFAFPPNKLNFSNYFLSFEKLLKDLNAHSIYGKEEAGTIFKSSLKHYALSYFYSFDHFKSRDDTLSENLNILKNLARDDNILILRPDKGNGIVLIDRTDYCSKMNDIISDRSKFKPMNDDCLKLIFRLEDKLNRFLKNLKGLDVIDENCASQMFTSGSQPGILYGLPKVHKDNYPLRPILSAIGTHSYKLAKFLVPLLSQITQNVYSLKDTFQFVHQITNIVNAQDYIMASFDVTSLFTNIPLDETIDIAIDSLFNDNEFFMSFNKQQLKKLLQLATKDNIFLFNGQLYSQIDGVAMGSPLGPTLANIFMCHYEKIWLDNCPESFKPVFYRRYVDDTFLLFRNECHINKFLEYLNS